MKPPLFGCRYIVRARATVQFTYVSLQVILELEIIQEYDHQMSNLAMNLLGDDRLQCLSDDSQECNSALGDDSQRCLDDDSQQCNSELGDDRLQCLDDDRQQCNSELGDDSQQCLSELGDDSQQ